MFGIGSTELLLILAVALIVVGPSKLPEIAKTLGRVFAEFKKVSSEVTRTIEEEVERQEEQEKYAQAQKELDQAKESDDYSEENKQADVNREK